MQTFVIHCCCGAGGLFLITVFAQLMGFDTRASFSRTGNAHDMGQGVWRGNPNVCLIGNHWQQYRKNSNLYYTHILQPDVFADHPDAKIVVIDVDPKDYRKVTELYVSKAWPELWTPQEYQKWAGPGWPPYSPTNIEESVMIRRELIDDLTVNETQRWFLENQHLDTHYRINFRTIMGIDQHDLVDVICDMMHGKANASVRRYVEQYQNLNKNLYFNDY